MLPKLACPLCWPAYAGLLSSVGLGFLISAQYLFAVTIGFLVLALAALAFRAKHRHGYGPFSMGLVAAAGVLLAGCMATAAAQSDRAIDLSSGVPFHLVEPTAPFTVTYEVGGATHSLEEYFERNFVTGFLVLRDSAILVERY